MTITSIIEIFAIVFFLKETNLKQIKRKINYNPFALIIKYLKDINVRIFIISLFILILSFSLYQWMFPVFLAKKFSLPAYITWYIMSGVWLVLAINQVFLLRRFWLKLFPLNKLFFIINIWIFILFSMLFFIKNLSIFLIVFFTLIAFQWVVNPIYQSEILENTSEHERWEVIWVIGALQSMSMFIWPLIWGVCIDLDISMFWFGAIIAFINILIVIRFIGKLKN
jgi:MFS family permease